MKKLLLLIVALFGVLGLQATTYYYYKGGPGTTVHAQDDDLYCMQNGSAGSYNWREDEYYLEVGGTSYASSYTVSTASTASINVLEKYKYYGYSAGGRTGCPSSKGVKILISTTTVNNDTYHISEFSFSAISEKCVNAASFNLSPFLTGSSNATFSGAGVTGTTFDPSAAGVGIHTITASRIFDNGTAVATVSITVRPSYIEQSASQGEMWLGTPTACSDASAVDLSDYIRFNTDGDVFSWNGGSGDLYTPSLGSQEITYTYTNNFGCTTDHIGNIEVTPAYSITHSNDLTICENNGITKFTASPSGGNWSGDNISLTGEYNPSGNFGDDVVYYSVTKGACHKSKALDLTVYPAPSVVAGYSQEFCGNAADIQSIRTDGVTEPIKGLGEWSVSPSLGGAFDANDETVDISAFQEGLEYVFTHSYTDYNGCYNENTKTIKVNSVLTPPAVDDAFTCSDGKVTLQVSSPQEGVTYKWYASEYSSDQLFIGTTYITPILFEQTSFWISATNAYGCESERGEVIARYVEVPTVDAGEDQEVCYQGGVIQLRPDVNAPLEGTWSAATGVLGNDFYAASLPPGPYTVRYTAQVDGCIGYGEKTVQILDLPTVNAGNLVSVCTNQPSVDLVDITTQGNGSWSFANDVFNNSLSGSIVDVTLLQEGEYEVIHNLTDSKGCSNSDSKILKINSQPDAPAIFSDKRCGTGSITFNVNNIDVVNNYLWYDNDVTKNLVQVGTSYSPDLDSSTTFFAQTKSDKNCYSEIISFDATILSIPTIDHPDQITSCEGAGGINLYDYISPQGGSFTTSTSALSGNSFFPVVSGVGIFPTTYQFTDDRGCSNSTSFVIEVQATLATPQVNPTHSCGAGQLTHTIKLPSANLSYVWYGVEGDSSSIVAGGTTYQTEFLNSSDSVYVQSRNQFGCTSEFLEVISEIRDIPQVSGGTNIAFCETDTTFALTKGSNDPSGGTWSGQNVINGVFTKGSLPPGNYEMTYTVTVDECFAEGNQIITIYDQPEVEAGSNVAGCANGDSIDLASNIFPADAKWSFNDPLYDQLINNNKVYQGGLDPGLYTISYTNTTEHGCSATDDKTVLVKDIPNTPAFTKSSYEVCGDDIISLQINSESGVYYSFYNDSLLTSLAKESSQYNVSLDTTTTYWVLALSNGDFCYSDTTSVTVVVHPVPDVQVPEKELIICKNLSEYPLDTVVSPEGGSYPHSDGVISGKFYPTTVNVGQHVITYSVTNEQNCTQEKAFIIRVIDQIGDEIIGEDTSICYSANPIDLRTWTSLTDGAFGGPGIVGETWYPDLVSQSALSITFVKEDNGCEIRDTRNIVMLTSPSEPEIEGDNIINGQVLTCAGSSLEFFADEGSNTTYEWYINESSDDVYSVDQNVNVNADSVKSIQLYTYNQIGCKSIGFAEVEINNEQPQGYVNVADDELLSGSLETFTFTSPETYSDYDWSFTNGTSASGDIVNRYLYSDTTQVVGYTLTVTSNLGCETVFSLDSAVTITPEVIDIVANDYTNTNSGIHANSILRIYPNPVSDVLQINTINLDEEVTYSLYDITGQLIYEGDFTVQTEVEVSSIPTGIYILDILGEQLKITVK